MIRGLPCMVNTPGAGEHPGSAQQAQPCLCSAAQSLSQRGTLWSSCIIHLHMLHQSSWSIDLCLQSPWFPLQSAPRDAPIESLTRFNSFDWLQVTTGRTQVSPQSLQPRVEQT
jgi:hypothetical protein